MVKIQTWEFYCFTLILFALYARSMPSETFEEEKTVSIVLYEFACVRLYFIWSKKFFAIFFLNWFFFNSIELLWLIPPISCVLKMHIQNFTRFFVRSLKIKSYLPFVQLFSFTSVCRVIVVVVLDHKSMIYACINDNCHKYSGLTDWHIIYSRREN